MVEQVIIKKNKTFRMNKVSIPAEICFHFILAAFALACVVPFIFVIIISFSSAESLRTVGYSFFPTQWSLLSYEAVFNLGDTIWRSFFNSILVTTIGTALSVFITVLYSYVLYRVDYPFRSFFAFLAFFTMLFGGGLAPTVVLIRNVLGLGDTYGALIIPMLISPFYLIIMRTFFKTSIPMSLIESASIDGSGEFRTLFTIVIPLAKPGIATVSLLTAIAYWNDWWLALLFIRDRTLYPLQYLLMEMQNNIDFIKRNAAMLGTASLDMANLPSEGLRMALCVIIVLPIACAYPFFQRYIIKGLTVGAIKE